MKGANMENGWHKFLEEKPPKDSDVLVCAEGYHPQKFMEAVWNGECFNEGQNGMSLDSEAVSFWCYLPEYQEGNRPHDIGVAE